MALAVCRLHFALGTCAGGQELSSYLLLGRKVYNLTNCRRAGPPRMKIIGGDRRADHFQSAAAAAEGYN
jgi:hypothetical protein